MRRSAKPQAWGEGTIYEYFENKEDIVFEIIRTFIAEHEQKLEEISRAEMPVRDKLFHFFYLLFENETARQHLNIYKEFIAISLMHETREMLDFSEACKERFDSILNDILEAGVRSKELDERMSGSANSLELFMTGLVVDSRLRICDVKQEIDRLLNIVVKSK